MSRRATGDLARLASACILPGVSGLGAPDWLRRELAAGLGGVVLFSRNVRDRAQLAALTAAIRAERPEALVAIDEEGGDVTRLEVDTGSSYPGNLALGVVDDPVLTERVAASVGADLDAVGVNLDLAPVADANTNPLNPVIGVRSFGSDPDLVARHVAAFVRGLQSRGVIACAKHFPGHGATEADSHLELPRVAADLDSLRAAELVPFRAAIEAGVRAVMTAHILVPAVDWAPATVSRAILHDLLREELGFGGLVVTDALEMRAISDTVGVEEGAVRALAAGADALCLGHDLEGPAVANVREAVVAAVRAGRLSEERLAAAAGRVVETGLWSGRAPRAGRPDRSVGALAARRALRVEGDVRLAGPAVVVECVPERMMAADPARHGLGEVLGGLVADLEVVRVTGSGGLAEIPAGREVVLVTRDPGRHAWEREVAISLLASRPDAVVVDVGFPGWRPDGAARVVTTYGAGRVSLEAAAAALAGA